MLDYSILQFVKVLTHERQIHADCLGEKYRVTNKGVPQRGVLSPLMYIIYVREIANKLPKSVSVSKFADDTALYSSISPPQKCKRVIEKAIETLSNNLINLGLELAPKNQY